MRLNLRSLCCFAFIVLVSWANMRFFGMVYTDRFSQPVNQAAHVCALMLIAAAGYYNWKQYKENWLAPLWLMLYGGILALLAVPAIMYLTHPHQAPHGWTLTIIAVRNIFTSPLPFLVCYILVYYSRRANG